MRHKSMQKYVFLPLWMYTTFQMSGLVSFIYLFIERFFFIWQGHIYLIKSDSNVSNSYLQHIYVCVCLCICMYVCIYIYIYIYILGV